MKFQIIGVSNLEKSDNGRKWRNKTIFNKTGLNKII